MSGVSMTSPSLVDRLTISARFGGIAIAWLFAAGVVAQVFLVGLSLFEAPAYLADHVDLGRMLGLLTYPLPILALLGRVGARLVLHAVAVAVLYILQMILANVGEGALAALHAVNAFVLLGASVTLGRRMLDLVRAH